MKHERQPFAMTSNDSSPSPWQDNPFLQRVLIIIDAWIETEWDTRERIRSEATALGWNSERAARYNDSILTTHALASRVDGMSEATFRRELAKAGAPTPGELIRHSRLKHAARLLVETRLRVRIVGKRAGYDSGKHFSDAFRAAFGMTPSKYRRDFLLNGRADPTPPRKP